MSDKNMRQSKKNLNKKCKNSLEYISVAKPAKWYRLNITTLKSAWSTEKPSEPWASNPDSDTTTFEKPRTCHWFVILGNRSNTTLTCHRLGLSQVTPSNANKRQVCSPVGCRAVSLLTSVLYQPLVSSYPNQLPIFLHTKQLPYFLAGDSFAFFFFQTSFFLFSYITQSKWFQVENKDINKLSECITKQ